MATTTANGMTIAYEEYGDGPPLLLVMGLGGQLSDWPTGLVDLLATRFRVVAFDNRDSGLSSATTGPMMTPGAYFRSVLIRRKPESDYLLTDMAADAVGLLDALGIQSAEVVGVSMGGMIAQTMAIEHPERVGSMTSIMSTTGHPRRGRTKLGLMLKLARRRPLPPGTPPEEVVEEALAVFRLVAGPTWDEAEVREAAAASIARSYRPDGTARQLAAVHASPDRTEALGTVSAPTLVVHGLLDRLVKPDGGVATAKAVPGSRLVMFPDMAHDLPRSRWQELVDAITTNAARSGVLGSSPA